MGEKGKNRLLALLGAAHSLNHSLFLIAPPLLLIIMNDLATSKLVLGLVGTISSLVYGVGSLVGGPLSDRINEVKIIIVSLALAGASTVTLIFATNIFIYSVALLLMAAWASLYHPTSQSLISKVFHSHMAEAMGLHGVGGTIGVMLTPTVAFVLGVTFGWRFSFLFFGALSVVIALLLIRNRFKPVRSRAQGGITQVFTIPGLWKIFVFNIAVGFYMKGLEYFLPTYLALKPFNAFGKSTAELWAAISATLVLAAGVPGQWLGGKAAGAFGSKKVLIACSLGVLTGLLFLQFAPFWFIGVPAYILLYGVFFNAHQPALSYLTGMMTPENKRGTMYGILFFTSFGLGSISQSIAGYFMDKYNIDSSFYVLTAFAFLALLLSFIIPDVREDKEEKEQRNS